MFTEDEYNKLKAFSKLVVEKSRFSFTAQEAVTFTSLISNYDTVLRKVYDNIFEVRSITTPKPETVVKSKNKAKK